MNLHLPPLLGRGTTQSILNIYNVIVFPGVDKLPNYAVHLLVFVSKKNVFFLDAKVVMTNYRYSKIRRTQSWLVPLKVLRLACPLRTRRSETPLSTGKRCLRSFDARKKDLDLYFLR